MSSSQLGLYLKKIDENIPINYPKFKKLVRSLNLPYSLRKESINSRKVKGDLYHVQILSRDLEKALRKMADLDRHSRVSLATQNRSHSKKVSGSILSCRKEGNHPYIIRFEHSGSFHSPADYQPSATCLVIENLENFLQISKTLEVLKNLLPLSPDPVEIVFADGMSVANSFHKKYFSQFNEILLFLDLDAGGLNIAAAVHNLVPEASVVFLIASTTEKALENVESLQGSEYLKKIEAIGRSHVFLRRAAELICYHRKIIEQEAFL